MADFANATIAWGVTPDTITLLQLLKDRLKITDNARDVELSMYLDMAGSAAEAYIDNVIDQREVVESLAKKRMPIAMRYWPLDSITSIVIEEVDVTDQWTTFMDDGVTYLTREDSTCSYEKECCFGQVTLTYVAGYDPLPADLGFAITSIAKSYEAETGAVAGQIKKETIVGVGSVEYATSDESIVGHGQIPAAVIPQLDKYRRLNA